MERLLRWVRSKKYVSKREREIQRPAELSDFSLLEKSDGFFVEEVGDQEFFAIREQLKQAPSHDVVDIGAGCNPTRGFTFFNATHVTAVDPAYRWYEYEADFTASPYSREVFGGTGEKQEMHELLQYTLSDLQMPHAITGEESHTISGIRNKEQRTITLLPVDAGVWITQQQPESVPNIIAWRVFPPAEIWGKLLASLQKNGILMTTGFGRTAEEEQDYPNITCGVDIDNSALPMNRKTQEIGLEGLTHLNNIYFYRKIRHLPAAEITDAILRNQ